MQFLDFDQPVDSENDDPVCVNGCTAR